MIGTRPGLAAATLAVAALLLLAALPPHARAEDKVQDKFQDKAQNKTHVMKITLATLDDGLHEFAKTFAAAVEQDSAGRIKAEIYPASQLGSIQRQIEGTQFGAIQCAVIAPEFFVGIDERFEVLAAPGIINSMADGQRVAADPAVRNLMLTLGADKGLHGAALFMNTPSSVIAKAPIRRLADLKGKKIRVFASQFQSVAMKRLGATPVAMTLGDVLQSLQDNVIDGAVSGIAVFTAMHYWDAAKFVTETGQSAIFAIVEVSKKWYDALPADLQQIIDKDAAAAVSAVDPQMDAINARNRNDWTQAGGELISLSADEQAAMQKILASVGDEVSNTKPQLSAAYKLVTEAAQRTR